MINLLLVIVAGDLRIIPGRRTAARPTIIAGAALIVVPLVCWFTEAECRP